MNKEAMNQLILEAISKKLGDGFHVSIQEVLKTNVKMNGLIIMKNGENVSPTIYLDSFYKDLENDVPINDIANWILKNYYFAKDRAKILNISLISDFEYVKDRLYVQLINRHSNEELLQDVPHLLFLDDFAVIVRCTIEATEKDTASFLVHNWHLNTWHTDWETLLSHSLQHTREMFGVELMSMKELMQKMFSEMPMDDFPDTHLWVMTNKKQMSGAATVLFDDVLKSFAKEHGDFYVIFSSIHEVLMIPASDDLDIETLTEMNREVNATEVADDEVLGTKAYYYCKDRGFVL